MLLVVAFEKVTPRRGLVGGVQVCSQNINASFRKGICASHRYHRVNQSAIFGTSMHVELLRGDIEGYGLGDVDWCGLACEFLPCEFSAFEPLLWWCAFVPVIVDVPGIIGVCQGEEF